MDDLAQWGLAVEIILHVGISILSDKRLLRRVVFPLRWLGGEGIEPVQAMLWFIIGLGFFVECRLSPSFPCKLG